MRRPLSLQVACEGHRQGLRLVACDAEELKDRLSGHEGRSTACGLQKVGTWRKQWRVEAEELLVLEVRHSFLELLHALDLKAFAPDLMTRLTSASAAAMFAIAFSRKVATSASLKESLPLRSGSSSRRDLVMTSPNRLSQASRVYSTMISRRLLSHATRYPPASDPTMVSATCI